MDQIERAPHTRPPAKFDSAFSFLRANGHGWVTTLLCAMFALMYLDRVNISAAAASIRLEFGLSNTELGVVFSGFSWAYLASVVFGGLSVRKYGARVTLFVCAALVGVATLASGLVHSAIGLFITRLLVGAGEGPAFPAATQAMRDWYRSDQFGYIQGITHSASRLGGALAPPLVAWIIVQANWRVSFLVCGGAALIWAIVWWLYFRNDPRTHRAVEPHRLEGLEITVPDSQASIPLGAIARRMASTTLVMFTYGWSYWIFLTWLPLYFANRHGTGVEFSAVLAGIPLLAGVAGNIFGGLLSDYVLRRTGRNRIARCGIVFVSLLGSGLALIPIQFTNELLFVVPLLALSMLLLELTIAPMYAVPMDITREYAGLGSTFIIMGVGIAGIVSPVIFGWLIDATGNWNVPFATAVLIPIIGAVAVLFVHPDRPFVAPEATIKTHL